VQRPSKGSSCESQSFVAASTETVTTRGSSPSSCCSPLTKTGMPTFVILRHFFIASAMSASSSCSIFGTGLPSGLKT
jgi:hypothetical protein